MKVYVAERVYDYEGFDIIGLFASRVEAQAACDNDYRPDGKKKNGDFYEIEEFDLTLESEGKHD